MYVKKDMLELVEAKFVGAYSDNGFDLQKGTLNFHPTAQRYEYGTVNIPIRIGLHAAIRFIQRIGIENVWKRDKALSTYLFEKLQAIPFVRVLSTASDTERSAMITFVHENISYLEPQTHLNTFKLRTRGVAEGGVNALRISCHVYNSFDELDRLIEGVRKARKG